MHRSLILAALALPCLALGGPQSKSKSRPKPAPLPAFEPAPLAPEPPPPPAPEVREITAMPDPPLPPWEPPAPDAVQAPPEDSRLELSFLAGAGYSSETWTSGSGQALVGAGLSYAFSSSVACLTRLEYRLSRQAYLTDQPHPDGTGMVRAVMDERRLDAHLGVGYHLGAALARSGRLHLRLAAGFQYSSFLNAAFPMSFLGPEGFAHLGWKLHPAVTLKGQLGAALNLTAAPTLSSLGAGQSLLHWGAGLTFPVGDGSFAVEAGYRGELLSLRYDGRVAHAAVLQFDSPL